MKTLQTSHFGPVLVETAYYTNGCLAVQLVSATDGEDIATLSVNLVDYAHLLKRGEFFVKTWSENYYIAREIGASGYFADTGRRIETPLGPVPVWRCP